MAVMLFRFMHYGLCALAMSFAFAVFATAAQAAELVMFRRDGCPYCAAWEREIGPVYPKTDVGRRAPLRILDLDRAGDSSVRIKSPIIYTPTFVLVDRGAEVGRIEGYPGDAFFWGLLDALLEKLPADDNGHPAAISAPASRPAPVGRSL
jgi:hypothetical protein